MMNFEDIKVGSTLYIKWYEVKVAGKFYDVDRFGKETPAVEIVYLNQPDKLGSFIVGDGNLSEVPLNCWNCSRELIDNVFLNVCKKCQRVHCPKCTECHCDTVWDPVTNKRYKKTKLQKRKAF
jgi:hypothetical protein